MPPYTVVIPETGNLTPIQKDIPVPEATRVLFEED